VAPEKPSGPLTVVAGLPPAVLLGAAAVMFLIAAGVVVMLVLGGRGEPTAPAPVAVATPEVAAPTPAAGEPAVPSIGRLLVESQPPGAEVSVNGDYRGITPLDLAGLPLGE
jgi:hypothetical protein